jgi:hypothetical protein
MSNISYNDFLDNLYDETENSGGPVLIRDLKQEFLASARANGDRNLIDSAGSFETVKANLYYNILGLAFTNFTGDPIFDNPLKIKSVVYKDTAKNISYNIKASSAMY